MILQLQMVPNQSDSNIPVPTLIRTIYLFRTGTDYEEGPWHVISLTHSLYYSHFLFITTITINYILLYQNPRLIISAVSP